MKRQCFIAVILSMLALLLGACTLTVPDEPATISPSPEPSPPVVTGDNVSVLVNGNSSFAFDLYRMLKEEDGNLFYSPYSVSMALAMTYANGRYSPLYTP